MRQHLLFMAVLSALLACVPAHAAVKTCTAEETRTADRTYASMSRTEWTWPTLYKSFVLFGHCANSTNKGLYDVELAEAYEEAVHHLLVDDWGHFPDLVSLVNHKPAFGKFVLNHMNEAFTPDDLAKVAENARLHCPVGATGICNDVRRATAPTNDPNQ